MRKIGYLRVSTAEQKPDRQTDGLRDICDELHIESLSAVSKHRPVYSDVMKRLQPGDVFVIWDLDRAYRSTLDALTELEQMRERNVSVQIANLSIDTSTPHGMLIYTIIGALAEFERRLLSQRTKEGLAAARKRGVRLGRPAKMTKEQLKEAAHRISGRKESVADIARSYGVAEWTLRRSLRSLN